jgi:membrane fusion protein
VEKTPLFRKEALTERRAESLGSVILVPQVSHYVFAAFSAVTLIAVLLLVVFGSYTRKERINGWLVPQHGLVQVFAPQVGVVTELFVEEGSEVRRGDPLLVLSAEVQSAALGATQSGIIRRLESQRESLMDERLRLERLTAQQLESLSARLVALELEQTQLESEAVLQQSRLVLLEKSGMRQRKLHDMGFESEELMQRAEGARLEQEVRLRGLERLQSANQRMRLSLIGEREDLPLKAQVEIANLARGIASVEQQLAEAEARREIVLPAPESGTVTAVQAERGSRPRENMPLLSIIPEGSELEAHIFTPSRAIGFLKAGQPVLLRYHAYPYQKFGHYAGVVSGISRSATNPSDLPPQLVGLTSLVGAGEPVYLIKVRLERQTVTAYGKSVLLHPGMQLQADVLIERKRLAEWIFDPLYTLTGRGRG